MRKLNFENMGHVSGGYRGKATLNRYGTNVNPFEPESYTVKLSGNFNKDAETIRNIIKKEKKHGIAAELVLDVDGKETASDLRLYQRFPGYEDDLNPFTCALL